MDYFEVFGLPRRLGLDPAELQRRFYELSRRYHPDFHQNASPEAQAEALTASARVNAAYRALRDPIARVDHLVRLVDGEEPTGRAGGKPAVPADLLREMLDLHEALAEAKASGLDAAARARLGAERERLRERYRAEERRLEGELAEAWDRAPETERPAVLKACREALARRAYLRTVIADLSGALGANGGGEG